MRSKKIVISSLLNQIQVGIIEDGRLAEFYLQTDSQQRTVGNIYKGKVENVLPGMSAAFVDIGAGKNAFLYVDDLPQSRKGQSVEQALRRGESLVVQVAKEQAGNKGPRVTASITLPGRFLVLLPHEDHLGVSRQISDPEERDRLREMAEDIKPPNMGLIVRTVAKGCSTELLTEDLKFLCDEWGEIEERVKREPAPALVYQDSLVYRILRDLLTDDVVQITVDSPKLYDEVIDDLKTLAVRRSVPVELYEGTTALFDYLGLSKELEKVQSKRVWLDCGGYIIIDQTEALISIDVNTGKYVGRDNLEETVLKTNLQAAEEIAWQLRLRNIGGIVIIDFIDMPDEAGRNKILEKLEEALAFDKTKTNVLGFTQLGLVEMTRKKSKKILSEVLQTACPNCGGTGRVEADETTAWRITQRIYSAAREPDVEAVLVKCYPAVAAQVIGVGAANLDGLEKTTGKLIFVRGDEKLVRTDFQIISGTRDRIEGQAYPVAVGDKVTAVVEEVHNHNKANGIARVDGFVIDCERAASLVGQTVQLEIKELHKTFASARVLND